MCATTTCPLHISNGIIELACFKVYRDQYTLKKKCLTVYHFTTIVHIIMDSAYHVWKLFGHLFNLVLFLYKHLEH